MESQTTGTDAINDRDWRPWVWEQHARAGADATRAITSWENAANQGPRRYNYSARPRRHRRTPAWVHDATRRADEQVRNTACWEHTLPCGADVIVTAQYYAPSGPYPYRDVTMFRWSVVGADVPVQLWTPRAHRANGGPIPVPPAGHPYSVPGRCLDTKPDWTEIDAAFPPPDGQ